MPGPNGLEPPNGDIEDNPPGDKVGGDATNIKTITDLLLGVVNWWCLKFGKTEVVNLVMRHFEHGEVYNSCLLLSDFLGLSKPTNYKNSAARPALDPCTNDLVKIMKDMVDSKQVPHIVIPNSQLGSVPLDAQSVSAERSVGVRLESLEVSVQSIVSEVEKLPAIKAPALLPMVWLSHLLLLQLPLGLLLNRPLQMLPLDCCNQDMVDKLGKVDKLVLVDVVGQVVDSMGKVDREVGALENGVDHHK